MVTDLSPYFLLILCVGDYIFAILFYDFTRILTLQLQLPYTTLLLGIDPNCSWAGSYLSTYLGVMVEARVYW